MTILIVEDDPQTASYLSLILQASGYRISGIADNGLDALRLTETALPDAIIMDIMLAGELDGIETAARVHARHNIPILYLTAFTDPKIFERAKITDPAAYLLKPFNARELRLAIELAIQRHRLAEQRMLAIHSQLINTLETMTDGFLVLDRDWRFAFVNRRFGEIFRREPQALLGKNIWEEFPDGVGRPFHQAYRRVMSERVAQQIEEYYEPWDRWFESRIFPSEDGISAYIQEITARKRAEKELDVAHQRLKALSARLLGVQEEERRTLARELHDELGQSLTALKISLQSLGLRPETAALQDRIALAVSIADAALAQARQMSLNLRPPQLDDLGLSAAIRWNLGRQAGLVGLDAQFHADDMPNDLPEAVAIACYRISQEALTNVMRHTQAQHLWLRLQRRNGDLQLEVEDDGVGFDPAQALSGAGTMGLASMEERATLVGGHLEIMSSPGKGCLIRAIFPLTTDAGQSQ